MPHWSYHKKHCLHAWGYQGENLSKIAARVKLDFQHLPPSPPRARQEHGILPNAAATAHRDLSVSKRESVELVLGKIALVVQFVLYSTKEDMHKNVRHFGETTDGGSW